MAEDPAYKICARRAVFGDHSCDGRITWEHVWKYAGRQINEKWAIIPLCEWAHSVNKHQDGGGLDKDKNRFISLMGATDDDLAKYPNRDWEQIRKYLKDKYEGAKVRSWGSR